VEGCNFDIEIPEGLFCKNKNIYATHRLLSPFVYSFLGLQERRGEGEGEKATPATSAPPRHRRHRIVNYMLSIPVNYMLAIALFTLFYPSNDQLWYLKVPQKVYIYCDTLKSALVDIHILGHLKSVPIGIQLGALRQSATNWLLLAAL
jgi:hypothetical protein